MGEHNHEYSAHIKNDKALRLECNSQSCEGVESPYPVLKIGHTVFWPSVDQLFILRKVITEYLESPDGIDAYLVSQGYPVSEWRKSDQPPAKTTLSNISEALVITNGD